MMTSGHPTLNGRRLVKENRQWIRSSQSVHYWRRKEPERLCSRMCSWPWKTYEGACEVLWLWVFRHRHRSQQAPTGVSSIDGRQEVSFRKGKRRCDNNVVVTVRHPLVYIGPFGLAWPHDGADSFFPFTLLCSVMVTTFSCHGPSDIK